MEQVKYRFYPNTSIKAIYKIKLIDKLLAFFLGSTLRDNREHVIKQITIVQLAHIGDLFLMLPAIKALKNVYSCEINLLVSSHNLSIARQLDFVDHVAAVDAPYFARGKKVSYWNFIKQLRRISSHLIFDVRGDLRNTFFIKLFTKHQLFAGYDVGGGGALLNIVFPYDHGAHITDLLEPLFKYLKVPLPDYTDYWTIDAIPCRMIQDEIFPENFLIVHLGVGAQARKWPITNFIKTIRDISSMLPVYVMGTSKDVTQQEHMLLENMPNVISCIGRYSLLESIYVVKQCSLFLGLDSGFTHIAALMKKKVVVLFSGTVNSQVWKPYSLYQDQISLVKRTVSCDWGTGCGRLECADNLCMKQIRPLEVISLIRKLLAKQA
jgi:heptosyltransferase-2